MNSYRLAPYPGLNPVGWFLQELENDLNNGHVDRGRNGELTARLLRTTFLLNAADFSDHGKRSSYAVSMVGSERQNEYSTLQSQDSGSTSPVFQPNIRHKLVEYSNIRGQISRFDWYGLTK